MQTECSKQQKAPTQEWKTTIHTKRHKEDVKQKNKENEINCEEAKRIRESAK